MAGLLRWRRRRTRAETKKNTQAKIRQHKQNSAQPRERMPANGTPSREMWRVAGPRRDSGQICSTTLGAGPSTRARVTQLVHRLELVEQRGRDPRLQHQPFFCHARRRATHGGNRNRGDANECSRIMRRRDKGLFSGQKLPKGRRRRPVGRRFGKRSKGGSRRYQFFITSRTRTQEAPD